MPKCKTDCIPKFEGQTIALNENKCGTVWNASNTKCATSHDFAMEVNSLLSKEKNNFEVNMCSDIGYIFPFLNRTINISKDGMNPNEPVLKHINISMSSCSQ